MASNKGKKKTNMAGKILTQTAVYVGDGLKDFLKDSMKTSAGIWTDAKESATAISSTFKNTTQTISSTLKALKAQGGLKGIANWYINNGENEFGDFGGGEDNLDFDIPTDSDSSAEISVAEMSESKQNANKISSSVISSSAKMVESNVQLTANIITSINNQTSAITSGFESVNETLGKITEAIAANQDALIKATAANGAAIENLANSSEKDPMSAMLSNGQFSLKGYKNIISQNVRNNPTLGFMLPWIQMAMDPNLLKQTTPKDLISMAIGGGMDKFFPGVRKTLEGLDDMVNKELMNLVIGLGDHAGGSGLLGTLGKFFGIQSDRQLTSGVGRSAFEVKATPFDTLTKEAITVTIPGYLQKILEAITGEDTVYDMRTRSFTNKKAQVEAYKNAMLNTNTRSSSTEDIENIFNGDYGAAFYDLMMADLGSKSSRAWGGQKVSDRRAQIDKFKEQGEFVKYAKDLLERAGVQQDELSNKWLEQTEKLIRDKQRVALRDISTQVAQENVRKNQQSAEYVQHAQLYQVDLSDADLSSEEELKRLAKNAGFKLQPHRVKAKKKGETQEAVGESSVNLTGVNYTNKALYEIYSILHRGINVFQVGSSKKQSKKFPDDKADLDKHLQPPANTRTISSIIPTAGSESSPLMAELMARSSEEDPNHLTDVERDEKGNVVYEDDPNNPGKKRPKKKSSSQRVSGWAKSNASNIKDAIFSGDPSKVIGALGHALRDVRELGQDKLKEGASKINTKYGNLFGSISHKLTGKGYTYIDPKTGEEVKIADNKIKGFDSKGNEIEKSGGLIGFWRDEASTKLNTMKNNFSKIWKNLANDFDFGDTGSALGGVKARRKKLMSTIIGAAAGGGILGGPIGLLVGSIAGSAIGMAGTSKKLNGLFFGRDKNGKPTGLFTKLGDHIVNPIRYQFQKTSAFIGKKLRKSIIGPLSDIGFVIKERISTAAKSRFGKVMKTIGNIITAPFKAVAKGLKTIITAPFKLLFRTIPGLLGKATRGIIGGTTSIIGGGLAAIASANAPLENRQRLDSDGNKLYENVETGEQKGFSDEQWKSMSKEEKAKWKPVTTNIAKALHERRKARNKEFNKDYGFFKRDEDGNLLDKDGNVTKYFWKAARNDKLGSSGENFAGGYKKWLEEDRAKKADRQNRLKQYTEEHPVEAQTNERVGNIEENVEQQTEQGSQILERTEHLGDFINEGLNGTSIHTQDIHVAERLDKIIDLMGGEDSSTNNESQSIEGTEPKDEKPESEIDKFERLYNEALEAEDYEAAQKYGEKWDRLNKGIDYGVDYEDGFGSPDIFDNESQEIDDLVTATKAASIHQAISTTQQQGEVNQQETATTNANTKEMIKDNPNLKTMASQEVEMNRRAIDDKDKEEEKKETIWDKILHIGESLIGGLFGGGLGDILKLGGIAGIVAAILNWDTTSGVLGGIVNAIGNIGNIIHQGFSNISKHLNKIFHWGDNGDNTARGINTVLNLADMEVENPANLITIGAGINHATQTAQGYNITNKTATHAKDYYLTNPLRKSYSKAVTTEIGADFQARRALKFADKAENYQNNGNSAKAIKYAEKAKKAADRSNDLYEQSASAARSAPSGMVTNMMSNAATLGITYGAGSLAEWGVKGIAGMLGADEQTQDVYGNIANSVTSAGLTVNKGIKNLTGRKGIIDHIKDFLMKMLEKMKADKAFKNVMGKLDGFVEKIISALRKKITGPVAEKVGKLFGQKAAEAAAKEVGGAATMGVGIAFGALMGSFDGAFCTEYLFNILPNDADEPMFAATIALKGLYGALEFVPYVGMGMLAVYVADTVMNGLGMRGPTQLIAQFLYWLFSGGRDDVLAAKQQKFDNTLKEYNRRFGSDLTRQQFNDIINNQGAFDYFVNGKARDADDGFDVLNSIDETTGLRKQDKNSMWNNIKRGVGDLFTNGGYSAYEEAVEQLADVKRERIKNTVASAADEKNWQVRKDWATANELYNLMPEDIKRQFDEAGDLAKFSLINEETKEWAKNITYAKLNEKKAIEEGIWTYDDAGNVNKGAEFELDETGTMKNGEKASNLTIDSIGAALRTMESDKGGGTIGNGIYSPWMPSAEAEANWKPQPTFPSAFELYQSLPKDLQQQLDASPNYLKELWDKQVTINLDGVNYNAAKLMAFAKLNQQKCIEAGLWKENDDGSFDKGNSQTIEIDTSGSLASVKDITDQSEQVDWDEEVEGTDSEGNPVFGDAFGSLGDALNNFFPGLTRGISDTTNAVLGLDETTTTVAENTQSTNKAVEELNEKSNGPDCIYVHEQGVRDILTRIENGVGSIYHDLHGDDTQTEEGILKVTDETTHSKISELSDYIHSTAVGVGQALIDEIPNRIAEAITTMVSSISDTLGNAIENLMDKIQYTISGSSANLLGPGNEVSRSVEHELSDSPRTWNNTIRAQVSQVKKKNWWDWFGIGGDKPTGLPSNIRVNENGNVTQSETQAVRSVDETQEGGNPLSKPSTLSLGYNGLWGDYYTPSHPHGGLDIIPADGSGNAAITSRWEGKITHVKNGVPGEDWNVNTAGNNVSILTTNPETGEPMTVRHMHLKYGSIPANIKEGTTVHVGDKIGEMGSTGASSGPHLHYQMNRGDVPTASQSDSNRLDPTPYYSGDVGSQTLNAGTASSASTTSGSSESGETGLAALVERIQEFGQEFLYNITGGLLGKKREEESGSSIASSTYTNSTSSSVKKITANMIMGIVKKEIGTTDEEDGVNKYTKWIYSAMGGPAKEISGITLQEVLDSLTPSQLQVYNKVGKKGLPANIQKQISEAIANEVNANTITKVYSVGHEQPIDNKRCRNWNVAFVLYCFNKAGVNIAKTDLSSILIEWLNKEATKNEWIVFKCNSMSADDTFEYGDIVVFKSLGATHVPNAPSNIMQTTDGRIFDSNKEEGATYTIGFIDKPVNENSDEYNVIIGGYRAKSSDKASVANVQMKLKGMSNATVYRAFPAGEDIVSQVVNEGDAEVVWSMLKELGYTDEQAAGIMGNIIRENGIRSRSIEGDIYGSKSNWDDSMYDTITEDRSQMDKYVESGLFPFYKRNGVSIIKDAYKSQSDGHLYSGMGFVGFTGDETRKYLDWLNTEHPETTWDSGPAQLAYMDERIRTKGQYAKLKKLFNENRDAAGMARAFYVGYEMPGHSENHEWATKAAEHAIPIYNKYKGTVEGDPGKRLLTDEELAKLEESNVALDGATGGPRRGRGGPKDEKMEIQAPNFEADITKAMNEGVGGDLDSGNYLPSSVPDEVRRRISGTSYTVNNTTGRTGNARYKSYSVTELPTIDIPSGTDVSEMSQHLIIACKYLQAIVDNTAAANDELSALNEKDFGVDKELRETIKAASKVKTHKELPKFAGAASMQGIINLAKP